MCWRLVYRGPCGHEGAIPMHEEVIRSKIVRNAGWEYCEEATFDGTSFCICKNTNFSKPKAMELGHCPRQSPDDPYPRPCTNPPYDKTWTCGRCSAKISQSRYLKCICGHYCCHDWPRNTSRGCCKPAPAGGETPENLKPGKPSFAILLLQ